MATRGQQLQSRHDCGVNIASQNQIKSFPFFWRTRKLSRGETAKYPTRRVICRSVHGAPTGYLEVSYEKLFSVQQSVRLVVGLVDNRAYNGARERNPFNFQHVSYMEIGIYLTGQLQGLKLAKIGICREPIRCGVSRVGSAVRNTR
jgi:hypothetical protein